MLWVLAQGDLQSTVSLLRNGLQNHWRFAVRIIIWSIGVSAALVSPAYAYLDPGTGSMLLQGLLGGIAAFFAVGGMYWQKLKSKFEQFRTKKRSDK